MFHVVFKYILNLSRNPKKLIWKLGGVCVLLSRGDFVRFWFGYRTINPVIINRFSTFVRSIKCCWVTTCVSDLKSNNCMFYCSALFQKILWNLIWGVYLYIDFYCTNQPHENENFIMYNDVLYNSFKKYILYNETE